MKKFADFYDQNSIDCRIIMTSDVFILFYRPDTII